MHGDDTWRRFTVPLISEVFCEPDGTQRLRERLAEAAGRGGGPRRRGRLVARSRG